MDKSFILQNLILVGFTILDSLVGKGPTMAQGVDSAACSWGPEIVSREDWGARPPTQVQPMVNPVPYVVIHHSYIPAACYTKEECVAAMQWMQNYHQINQSWNDIGYSFGAGGDNRIYTGRGWSAVGAHAPGYNNRSIGICLIGDWREEVPPKGQLLAVKQLIRKGVKEGYIQKDYKLIGHRQVRETECPGDALFNEIKTWPHWVEDPSYTVLLKSVPEIVKEGLKPDPREDDVVIPNENDKLIENNLEKKYASV